MVRMGHPRFLSSGSRMAPFLSHAESTQHTSSPQESHALVNILMATATMKLAKTIRKALSGV